MGGSCGTGGAGGGIAGTKVPWAGLLGWVIRQRPWAPSLGNPTTPSPCAKLRCAGFRGGGRVPGVRARGARRGGGRKEALPQFLGPL